MNMKQKFSANALIVFALALGSLQFASAQSGEERPYKSTKIQTEEPEKQAQDGKKDKKEAEKPADFKSRLWYGGGIGLGFGAYNGTSSFGVGISPMVGYKFLNFLSAGPRVSIFYSSLKYAGFKPLGLLNTEAGVFLRGHVYRGFFVQGDLSYEWVQEPYEQIGTTITKRTFGRPNQYLGIGYNFGRGEGGAGSEISLHYNFAVASDINSYEQPIDYRFAFTWRF